MKIKKIIAALLASVSAVSMLAACGGGTGANIDMDEIMSRENVEDYVYPEQVEIKIPVYDRGTPGQASVIDNYWTKYVQSEFGDKHNIKVSYISIPRKEEITKFNQLLAGKVENQPDIIFNYDYPSIVSFADQGAFQELDLEMIKKYAPDYYEATKSADEYTLLDGTRYFLAGARPDMYQWVTLLRKDWLDKCGISAPTTSEEYLDMLKTFRDKKPGGEETIPLTKNLVNANYGNYPFREFPLPEEDNALYSDITVCSLTWEPTKKQLQYDNMLYNEGLISPEWYLDKDGSKMKEQFISGKAGIFGTYLSKSDDVIGNLKKNDPSAEVMLLPAYQWIDENGNPYDAGSRQDNPFGMMSGINVNCAHPEAVLMYFEWMQDNLFTMQNGIEGVTYTMDGEIPVPIDDYTGEERLNYSSNKDMWCIVIESKDMGDDELNMQVQAKMYAPEGYEFLIEENYKNAKKYEHLRYHDFIFNKPIVSLTESAESLLSKWQEIQVNLINCKPEEFDAKYEAACQEYLAAGYQEVLDEKKEVYEAMKAEK